VAVYQLQPFVHAGKANPGAVTCFFRFKTTPGILNNKFNLAALASENSLEVG
jgi:hypothetical protein